MYATERKRFYTTFEIGRMCGVFPTTVINWVKTGKLKSSTTPGGHRRVPREELISFMNQFKYPLPPELMSLQRRVLIVDDDPSVCRLLARAFKDVPHLIKTETLSSGIDALVELGKNPPDLVFLDVVMPVVDGASLCASLKANPATSGVKIIGITGKRLPEKKQRYIEENTHAFFRKPFELDEVRAAVAKLLHLPLEAVAPALSRN